MNKKLTIVTACLLLLVQAACMSPLTPQPTATSARLPTLIPTFIRTPMPTASATATSTLKPVSQWSSQSPNGKWIVQGTMEGPFADSPGGGDMYHTRLDVIRADETVTWTVRDQTSPYGLGYTIPRSFYWTRDGHYFYFTNEPVPDGCAIFVNGSDLYRVDLTTGHATQIVSPSVWWLSISPDEKKVAYIYWNGDALEIVMREITSGTERRMKMEAQYTQAGSIIWSPDGKALMLTLAANPCDSANWLQSVVRLNVALSSQAMLIRDDKRLFITTEWPEANKVLLKDKDGNSWSMNATTGKLEQLKDR